MNKKVFAAVAGLIILGAVAIFWLAAPAPARNFLWEIEAPNGVRAYILGSIHLASASLYPLNPVIEEDFGRSAALVVEIDTEAMPPELVANFIAAHGYAADGRPILERLSPETRDLLRRSGLYRPQLDPLEPWLAALVIQMEVLEKHGFTGAYGLDRHFIDQARKREMPVIELETLDEQMGLLADMNEKEADLFLRSAVVEMDELPNIIGDFLKTWRKGDTAGFADIFFKEYDKYPELVPLLDKIIFHRNERMAARINALLEKDGPRPLFIVVGAGHLVGDRSILVDLAARGYIVRQR